MLRGYSLLHHEKGSGGLLMFERNKKEAEGHWFVSDYKFFTCSECGHEYSSGCKSYREAFDHLAKGRYPRECPECSARMKGGE